MNTPTILVIEDNHRIKKLVEWTLAAQDYAVITASDGEEGLKLVEQADLILLDLQLPKLSGEEFLKTIRQNGNDVPVIVISAISANSVLDHLQKYRIVYFVEKPFSLSKLSDRIHEALRVSRVVFGETIQKITEFVERQEQYRNLPDSIG